MCRVFCRALKQVLTMCPILTAADSKSNHVCNQQRPPHLSLNHSQLLFPHYSPARSRQNISVQPQEQTSGLHSLQLSTFAMEYKQRKKRHPEHVS